jgi:hypothetical protein
MIKFSTSASSSTTFTSAIAFFIGSVAIGVANQQAPAVTPFGFEANMTYPSYHGVSDLVTTPAPAPFEERLAAFYTKLSSVQVDLAPELQKLLMENMSQLYED